MKLSTTVKWRHLMTLEGLWRLLDAIVNDDPDLDPVAVMAVVRPELDPATRTLLSEDACLDIIARHGGPAALRAEALRAARCKMETGEFPPCAPDCVLCEIARAAGLDHDPNA